MDVNIEGVTVLQTAQKAHELTGKRQYFFCLWNRLLRKKVLDNSRFQ